MAGSGMPFIQQRGNFFVFMEEKCSPLGKEDLRTGETSSGIIKEKN